MKESDIDRIDQYLRQELSPEEVIAFEMDMQSDQDLAEEVELRRTLVAGIHHHHREKIRAIFEEEEKLFSDFTEDENEAPSSAKIRYLKPLSFLMAAAAIILIFFLLRPIILPPVDSSPEKVFNQFAMHYTGGDLISRNVDTCILLSDAINIYEQKDYRNAIPKFQHILNYAAILEPCGIKVEDIELLMGISYVFEDQMDLARPLLKNLSQEKETAKWYYILSFVKEGNWQRVKGELSAWTRPSPFYEKRMRELEAYLP